MQTREHNRAAEEYIRQHWKGQTDFQMMQACGDDFTVARIRGIRHRLFLVRDPSMMARMYAAHRDGRVYLGRGANRRPRDQSYKVNKYNGL